MQLEIKKGFSLLELLAVLALTGIFIYALSGFLFSGNKDKQWLDVTFESFLNRAEELTSRMSLPHGIEVDASQKCLVFKIVRLEAGSWKDAQIVMCPQGISLDLGNSSGYQLDGENPVFPVNTDLAGASAAKIIVFIVNGRNVEYHF
jgi:prepilin-type N-terminal cleavage/methylation domain-containing protein